MDFLKNRDTAAAEMSFCGTIFDGRFTMLKKRLGILGGMGPEATAVLYERITKNTEAACDRDHLDILIWSHASRTSMISCSGLVNVLRSPLICRISVKLSINTSGQSNNLPTQI